MDETHSRTVVKFHWINHHYSLNSSSAFLFTIRFSHVSLPLFYNYLIITEEFGWQLCYVKKDYSFVVSNFFFQTNVLYVNFSYINDYTLFSFIKCAICRGEKTLWGETPMMSFCFDFLLNKAFLKFITISSSCYIELRQN